MKSISRALGALLVATLAACGGGSGGSSALAPTAPTVQSTPNAGGGIKLPSGGQVGNATASATVSSGFPLSTKSSLRKIASLRNTQGFTISSVEVDGTIYPGYAGASPVTNTQTLTPVSNQIIVSLPFSNVPVGNNEVMALHLLGVAPDGSKFDLGYLASLVNITSGGTTPVTLNAASTQVSEVFAGLLSNDVLSSPDVADANLPAYLASQITASGQTPDPATQLFTPAQLTTIDAPIAVHYTRNVTLNATAADGSRVYFIADFTNQNELNLQANRNALYYALPGLPFPTSLPYPSLSPCSTSVPAHAGPTPPVAPGATRICNYRTSTTGNTVSLQGVYGGPLIAVVEPSAVPFTGATLSLASIAPGTTGVMNATLAPVDQTVTITDPAAFAFPNSYNCNAGQSCGYSLSTVPGSVNQYYPDTSSVPSSNNPSLVAPLAPATNTFHLEAMSPLGLPLSSLQFCTGTETDACLPLAGLTTHTVKREFNDPGTNFSYFNWQAGTGVTSIGQGYYCSAYGMYVNTGGSTTGSFSTSTQTYLGVAGRSATLYIGGGTVYPANGCSGTRYNMQTSALWSASVTDSNGHTYTSSPMTTPQAYGISFAFPTLTQTVTVTNITFTFTIPSGTTPPAGWGIHQIYGGTTGNGGGGGGFGG